MGGGSVTIGMVALAALFLLLLTGGLALTVRRRRMVASALGDASILRQLLGYDIAVVPPLTLTAVAAGGIAIALALLDPGLGAPRSAGGDAVVLVLDASGSMLATDVGPTRLDLQRSFARSLAADLAGRPIGVVAFAGRAFTLTPPTTDPAAIEMYLATIDPTVVTQSGSSLGPALRQAAALLGGPDRAGAGTIILFTDGDETEDRTAAIDAASLARRGGSVVHTVAVGTPSGGPVPALDPTSGVTDGFLRDAGGGLHISRSDPALLRTIARRGGGIAVSALDTGASETLGARIGPGASPRRGGIPAYAWLAVAALLLLSLEPLGSRWRRQ